MEQILTNNTKYLIGIKVISLIVPIAVAVLIFLPAKIAPGEWVYSLPFVNAMINTVTSIILVLALAAIVNKKIRLHRTLMSAAFAMGALFLLSYVTYHASVDSVVYGDLNGDGILDSSEVNAVGQARGVYLFILLSHILLSLIVVPMVLFALYFSLSGQISKHKRIVKFAYPIWLYVSVSGVAVYLMIRSYYTF